MQERIVLISEKSGTGVGWVCAIQSNRWPSEAMAGLTGAYRAHFVSQRFLLNFNININLYYKHIKIKLHL